MLDATISKSHRKWLWDFTDNAQCSVLGTCLSHKDLLKLARKLKLGIEPGVRDYEMHGYFVTAASKDNKATRFVHKLLDKRFKMALRHFSQIQDSDKIVDLWNSMKESGKIAAAYYAIMTIQSIPSEIRSDVFGEVHMLSHLMGASYRKQSIQVDNLRAQLGDVLQRSTKNETGYVNSLKWRDEKIKLLEDNLTKAQFATAKNNKTEKQNTNNEYKIRAAYVIDKARQRARESKNENMVLQERIDFLEAHIEQFKQETTVKQSLSETTTNNPFPLDGISLLYIGGRNKQVAYFRKLAREAGGELIHHDGGLTDALTRIDEILPSVDCVLCPISCVSHGACLRAKSGCKKHGKKFVPLRSASQSSLLNAFQTLISDKAV